LQQKNRCRFGFFLLGRYAAFFFEAPFDAKPSPFFPPS
jgi:hypothetical protein